LEENVKSKRKTPDASRRNDASLSPCVRYRNFRERKDLWNIIVAYRIRLYRSIYYPLDPVGPGLDLKNECFYLIIFHFVPLGPEVFDAVVVAWPRTMGLHWIVQPQTDPGERTATQSGPLGPPADCGMVYPKYHAG